MVGEIGVYKDPEKDKTYYRLPNGEFTCCKRKQVSKANRKKYNLHEEDRLYVIFSKHVESKVFEGKDSAFSSDVLPPLLRRIEAEKPIPSDRGYKPIVAKCS